MTITIDVPSDLTAEEAAAFIRKVIAERGGDPDTATVVRTRGFLVVADLGLSERS
jgi:hypothetical protein